MNIVTSLILVKWGMQEKNLLGWIERVDNQSHFFCKKQARTRNYQKAIQAIYNTNKEGCRTCKDELIYQVVLTNS